MQVKFTARRFRAHPDVKAHAVDSVKKLDRFYDGIVTATIVLSYERASNSVKTAEVILHVYGTVLSAKVKSQEYHKSIDAAVAKLEAQLARYKAKLRAKDKSRARALHDKI